MLAQTPIHFEKVSQAEKDKEILRVGMIAELDAVNLYEQLAAATDDKKIKKVLLDIAREEKTHAGEFEALLVEKDPDQAEELEKGKKEVREL